MENKKRILGVDLGGTNIRAGLTEGDRLLDIRAVATPADEPQDVVLETLYELITRFDISTVDAVGIGVPTVVDVERGIVYNATNIKSWKEVHLKAWLEERLHLPVFVNNDANCFAAGEKYFGKAKDFHSVAAVVMGTGLGTGLIIQNKLYEGRNCGAGEISNLPYLLHNYEYYCSGQYFRDEHQRSGAELMKEALDGDKNAAEIFHDFGWHFGKFLQAILYAYDPEMIVLGGSVSRSFDLYKESMFRSLRDGFIFPGSVDNLKMEVSDIENVAVYGAASLFYDSLQKDRPA